METLEGKRAFCCDFLVVEGVESLDRYKAQWIKGLALPLGGVSLFSPAKRSLHTNTVSLFARILKR